jgi:hypothetical protein
MIILSTNYVKAFQNVLKLVSYFKRVLKRELGTIDPLNDSSSFGNSFSDIIFLN